MNTLTRIRNWPWAYIGRRAAVTAAFVVGFGPWAVILLAKVVVGWFVWPIIFGAFTGDAGAAITHADDGIYRWTSLPWRMRDWADDAKPAQQDDPNSFYGLINQLISQGGTFAPMGHRVAVLPPAPQPPIPDDPNPVLIRGWRSYTVSNGHLLGMTNTRWSGPQMQAGCQQFWGVAEEPTTPAAEAHLRDATCACGIYVLKDRPAADAERVIAEVVGWGAYVEYERGWRCQYVRIERLYLPDTAVMLRERYGCPVELEGRE